MPSKVGTKGQVVIEKQIRDQLGIEPGALAIQRVVDGHVEIYFVQPPSKGSLFGSLRPYISEDVIARVEQMEWHEIQEEAWSSWVRERYGIGDDGE